MRIVIAIMDKPNLGYARPFLDCWQLIVVCITSYATIAGLAEWSKARHLRCPLSVRRGFEPHSQHGFWFGVTELRVWSDILNNFTNYELADFMVCGLLYVCST